MTGAKGALMSMPPPVIAPKMPIISGEVLRSSSVSAKSGSINDRVNEKITKQVMADAIRAVAFMSPVIRRLNGQTAFPDLHNRLIAFL